MRSEQNRRVVDPGEVPCMLLRLGWFDGDGADLRYEVYGTISTIRQKEYKIYEEIVSADQRAEKKGRSGPCMP